MTVRARIAAFVAEFLGTAVLATAAINVARSQIGIGYFVAFSVAITLAVLVLMFGKASGGHFNPAVTLGLWTMRKVSTLHAVVNIVAQMFGGLAAWQMAKYFVGQELTNVAGKSFNWKVLVAELVGTAIFTMGIAAAVSNRFEGGKLAAVIGASLFVGTVVASIASNAVLNPAIALANQSWGRAYIFGPILGSVVGMNMYAYLFAPSREVATAAATVKVTSSRAAVTKKRPVAKKASAKRKSR